MHWIRKTILSALLLGVAATAGAAPVFRVGETVVDAADLEGMTENLTRDMVEAAAVLAKKPGSFWTDQLNNTDQLAAPVVKLCRE